MNTIQTGLTKAFNLLVIAGALCFAPAVYADLNDGHLGNALTLRMLWQSDAGGGNLFSSNSITETSSYATLGQMFYLPYYSQSGSYVLNRLYYNSTDHMDSPLTNEGGYSYEGWLGYLWSSQQAGTSRYLRALHTGTGDHGFFPPNGSLSTYSSDWTGGYAYPRYGTAAEVLTSVSGGNLTVNSNAVSGGAVWTWTWNGTQFINQKDYGRLMQATLNPYNTSYGSGGAAWYANPTEGGDGYLVNDDATFGHGSPLLSITTSGNTQSTRAIPLEWNTGTYGGGAENPTIWKDVVLGKDLILGFNSMNGVAKYTTIAEVPASIDLTGIEIPSVYVRANFDHFYAYNAETSTLTSVSLSHIDSKVLFTHSSSDPASVGYSILYGGAIVADASGDNALGLYGVAVSEGGSVERFTFVDLNDSSGTAADSNATNKINAAYYGPMSSGHSEYNVWVITDTLANVQAKMDSLYSQNVK